MEKIKLKYVAKLFNGNSIPDNIKDFYVNKNIPYIATKDIDVLSKKINYDNGLSVNSDDEFKFAPKNSILMCIEGGSAGKKIAYTDRQVAFVNKLCCFDAVKIKSKLLYYCLQSQDFLSQFFVNLTGLIGGVGINTLNNLYISMPQDEIYQEKLYKLLDEISNKINSLIEVENKQIENLKEYKKIIISNHIKFGLNKYCKKRDSEYKWIGEINEDYVVKRLKFCLSESMIYGANESGEKPQDTTDYYRYIRITDITSDNKLKNSEDNLYLSKEKGKQYLLSKLDILFARSGGTVGKTFMYLGEENESTFAGYLIKARCNPKILLPEFLMYFTQSSIYEVWKNMIFIQATIQNIGASKYSNMEIIIPNIYEQKTIVEELKLKCSKIDVLIDIKLKKIEKLNDYKKSVIYEYITGKRVL